MPKKRKPSTESGSGSVAKQNNGGGSGSGSGGGGGGSRVFGIFRRASHDDTTNSKEKEKGMDIDNNWAQNYKITHQPDRPLRDRREQIRNRDSEYALGWLNEQWQKNEKRRERKATERSWSHDDHGRETARQSDGTNTSTGGHGGRLPRALLHLQTGSLNNRLVPNFSYSRPPPNFDKKKNEWITNANWEQKPQHQLPSGARYTPPPPPPPPPTPPPKSPPSSSIIRVHHFQPIGLGLGVKRSLEELKTPTCSKGDFLGGGRGADSGRFNNHVKSASTSTSASPTPPHLQFLPQRTYSPQPVPSPSQQQQQASTSSQKNNGPLAGVQLRWHQQLRTPSPPPSPSPAQRPKVTKSETYPSVRDSDRHESVSSLYLDYETETLTRTSYSSSRASSPILKQTRKRVSSPLTPFESDRSLLLIPPPLKSQNNNDKTCYCPMPLCGEPLLTPEDRQQNLCLKCRRDHQLRESTFMTTTSSHHKNYDDDPPPPVPVQRHPYLAKDAVSISPYEIIETEMKTIQGKPGTKTWIKQPHQVHVTELQPNNGNLNLKSKFNKDIEKDHSEFKLQAAPRGRKYQQHRARHEEEENSKPHISVQLSRTSTPTPNPPSPIHPILEPKTFRRPSNTNTSTNPVRPTRRASVSRTRVRSRSRSRKQIQIHTQTQTSTNTPRGQGPNTSPKSPNPRNRHQPTKPKTKNPTTKEEQEQEEDIYQEIESIIDIYLRLPDTPDAQNQRRKSEAVASYYTTTLPLDVEMKSRGFI